MFKIETKKMKLGNNLVEICKCIWRKLLDITERDKSQKKQVEKQVLFWIGRVNILIMLILPK